jgi:hypothetical protein
MRAYGNTNAAPYASAPAAGLAGDTYWNTTTKTLYVSDGTAWIAAGPMLVSIGTTAPTTPAVGQLWWRSDTGKIYVYYDDGTSSQWAPVNMG